MICYTVFSSTFFLISFLDFVLNFVITTKNLENKGFSVMRLDTVKHLRDFSRDILNKVYNVGRGLAPASLFYFSRKMQIFFISFIIIFTFRF